LAVNGADVLADVSAIRTNITEITTNLGSPSSASGVTGSDAFSKINTINNLVGAVPSGETVESQITSLNSNIIQAPSSVSLQNTGRTMHATFMSGLGFFIEIALPKIPLSITCSNGKYYDGSWKDFTIEGFSMAGSTCIIKINSTSGNPSPGAYGVQGTLNLTY